MQRVDCLPSGHRATKFVPNWIRLDAEKVANGTGTGTAPAACCLDLTPHCTRVELFRTLNPFTLAHAARRLLQLAVRQRPVASKGFCLQPRTQHTACALPVSLCLAYFRFAFSMPGPLICSLRAALLTVSPPLPLQYANERRRRLQVMAPCHAAFQFKS